MRASMISLSAREKRSKWRNSPGKRLLLTSKPVLSPKNICNTSRCAPSRPRCPDGCSGVRRRDECHPRGVGLGVRVAVLIRPLDRRPGPPKIPVVLVVPGVDRRIGAAQVHHREQECAVVEVDGVLINEVPGDCVPREPRPAGALPEERDVRLLGCADGAVRRAERLDLVEVLRVRGAGKRVRAVCTKLRGALHQKRPHAADPRGWVEHVHERLPMSWVIVRHLG
jgi:hypothetical protein